MKKYNYRLVSYTGQTIPAIGKAKTTSKIKRKFHPVEFQIIKHPVKPATGLQTYEKLNLVKIVAAFDTQWDANLELLKKMWMMFLQAGRCFEGIDCKEYQVWRLTRL